MVYSGLILLRLPANMPTAQDEVELAMAQVHEPICAHLRIDDPKCLQRRYTDTAELPAESHGRYRPWESLFSVRAHKCPNRVCDTHFYSYRKRVKGESGCFDELVLAIYRHLGSLRTATDPKWIGNYERIDCITNPLQKGQPIGSEFRKFPDEVLKYYGRDNLHKNLFTNQMKLSGSISPLQTSCF